MTPCTLIVDDDQTNAEMLAEGLREAGWNARAAIGVEEALSRMNESPYSLVVSDICMYDGDGFDLLRAVSERDRPVPVILMSSFGTGATPQQALAAGAYAYLPKPFPLDALLALVTRAHAEPPLPA
jgi:two-component system, NtrC family, nitrogen regulation response regulator GlnG